MRSVELAGARRESNPEPTSPLRLRHVDRLISRRTAAENRDLRIDRNTPFLRSSYRFMEDFFHTMVETNNLKLSLIFFGLYNCVLVMFAVIFHLVQTTENCHVDYRTYSQALFFSLQTMSSIGYGSSDPYFNSCFSMYFFVMLESFIGILLSSIAAGVVFARFGRSQSRAASIIFSKKATVSMSGDVLKFQFRVADLREVSLLEAKIRAYAIRNLTDLNGVKYHYRATQLRLQYPDDGLGGMLMLALPSICASHQMSTITKADGKQVKSPLVPPEVQDIDRLSFEQFRDYWNASNMEVLILVEGVVPSTSGSTQARWSYKIEDIVWQQEFVPCVETIDTSTNHCCQVDFTKFNQVQPVSKPV